MGRDLPVSTGVVRQSMGRRWWRRALGVTVLALGAIVACYWFVPFYRVTVDNAITWDGPPLNQTYPRGTECTVTLTNPLGHEWASAEATIENWVDDTGQDLMIRQVLPTQFHQCYGYQVSIITPNEAYGPGSGMVAPSVGTYNPRKLQWQLSTSVLPSPAAQAMRVAGRVVVVEGGGVRRTTMKGLSFQPGAALTVGEDRYVVEAVSAPNPNEHTEITLKASNCRTPLKAVRVLDDAGRDIKSTGRVSDQALVRRHKVTPAAGQPEANYFTIAIPYGLSSANLEVEYWSRTTRREYPFAATLPLQRKNAHREDFAGPVGSVLAGLTAIGEKPIPQAAWGPAATDARAEDLFEVRHAGTWTAPGPHPQMEATFSVRCKRPLAITTFDAVLTGCRDSEGNQLLGAPTVPSTTDERWGVWPWPDPRDTDARRALFMVFTTRMPAPTARSMTLQGRLRIQVGEEPTSAEAKNVRLEPDQGFTLGPVAFTFSRPVDTTDIELWTRGNLGLLREVEVLSPDGSVLSHTDMARPHFYYTDAYLAYLPAIKGHPTSGLTIRGTYLLKTRHYILPFAVTIPTGPVPMTRPTTSASPDAKTR